MSSKLPGFAANIVYAWTRVYTWRLPARLRDDRRREIASDLWESHHDSHSHGRLRHGLRVLGRMLAGMPDDVLWRWEQPRPRRPRAAIALVLASMAVLIAAALWVADVAQVEPPELPAMIKVVAYPKPPPPPPPPPPPDPRTGRARR